MGRPSLASAYTAVNYGQGVTAEGVAYHAWGIRQFAQMFAGFAEGDVDDWKAVVYKWGGPKPSWIERTALAVARGADGPEARLLWWPKPGIRSEYSPAYWGGVRWYQESAAGGGSDVESGRLDSSNRTGDREDAPAAGQPGGDTGSSAESPKIVGDTSGEVNGLLP